MGSISSVSVRAACLLMANLSRCLQALAAAQNSEHGHQQQIPIRKTNPPPHRCIWNRFKEVIRSSRLRQKRFRAQAESNSTDLNQCCRLRQRALWQTLNHPGLPGHASSLKADKNHWLRASRYLVSSTSAVMRSRSIVNCTDQIQLIRHWSPK